MALTDEQKRLRVEAYGSSEAPTVVGVGYGKLIDLYESKVNPLVDEEENLDDMLAAELGTLEEAPIARVYERRTRCMLERVVTLRHPTKPLAVATPDRARFTAGAREAAIGFGLNDRGELIDRESLEYADRLVEVKRHAAQFRRDYGPEGTGQVPEHEAIQTTWQMGVTGVHVADIPVLFVNDWGCKLEVFTVTFNQELFDWIYECVERFHHDHVLKRVPPPPDGSDRYDEALARMFPADRKPAMVADESDERLMLDFAKYRELVRRAETLKQKLGQQLKVRIGDASGMTSARLGKLSWTRSRDKQDVDWQRAAQGALTLAGQCLDAFDTLKAAGEHLSDSNRAQLVARLKSIIPDATVTKPGHRSLRFTPAKGSDADLELARLQLALDALGE